MNNLKNEFLDSLEFFPRILWTVQVYHILRGTAIFSHPLDIIWTIVIIESNILIKRSYPISVQWLLCILKQFAWRNTDTFIRKIL